MTTKVVRVTGKNLLNRLVGSELHVTWSSTCTPNPMVMVLKT